VELELYAQASVRQHRELGAFVRYCVARLERELQMTARWWLVKILPARGGFACDLVVQHASAVVQANGQGHDGPLAAWEALCRIEQLLRETVAAA
jgi:hypothetical protein